MILQRYMRRVRYALGAEQGLYRHPTAADAILMYHNIFPKCERNLHLRNCSAGQLRDDLRYVKKRFSVVSLREMYATSSRTRRVAITFDDGLVNNLHHALPVLNELRLPATFFCTTSRLYGRSVLWPDHLALTGYRTGTTLDWEGKSYHWTPGAGYRTKQGTSLVQELIRVPAEQRHAFLDQTERVTGYVPSEDHDSEDYWRVMKAEELRLLASGEGIEIGSHGALHTDFTTLSEAGLKQELLDSRVYLQQATGQEINSVAYPFGHYNDEVVRTAQTCGYTMQLAVTRGEQPALAGVRFRTGLYNDLSFAERMHRVNLALSEVGSSLPV